MCPACRPLSSVTFVCQHFAREFSKRYASPTSRDASGAEALGMLKRHLDDGLAEHMPQLYPMVSTQITQLQDKAWALAQLKSTCADPFLKDAAHCCSCFCLLLEGLMAVAGLVQAAKYNEEMMALLASEADVEALALKLNTLKRAATRPPTRSYAAQTYNYWTGGSSAAVDPRAYRDYLLAYNEYVIQKSTVQKEVTEVSREGLKEMLAHNPELAGKYLNIIFFVRKHLDAHLETATRSEIQTFEAAAKDSLNGKLSNLQSLMSSGAATWIFMQTHLGGCRRSYANSSSCSSYSLTRQA